MLPKPWILGGEASGEIVKVGDGVENFRLGDRVIVCIQLILRRWGCYAEYVRCQASHCALLWRDDSNHEGNCGSGKDPQISAQENMLQGKNLMKTLSMEAAAGLPLCGLTALQALDRCNCTSGDSILIHAGAGGLGSLLIQIAKCRGLKVTTTSGPKNVKFLYDELKVDRVVDYTIAPFEEQLDFQKSFHAIIDSIGGEYESRSKSLLLDSGTFVSVLNSGWVYKYGLGFRAEIARIWSITSSMFLSLFSLSNRYRMVAVQPSGKQLEELVELIRSGKIIGPIG